MKGMARRANFSEGSTKVVKAYKAEVSFLTSENADLQAQMQRLAKDAMKFESNLKHTTTMKARAEDKEKKARGELRVAENKLWAVRDELQVAKDELHVVQDELHIKATTFSWLIQEASEAMSSVEHLIEECHRLRKDLWRQEALVSQKKGVIAELRDKACTLWASGWLSFQCKATKAFSGLDFNFQVLAKGEAEESDLMMLSDAPDSVPFPSEPEIEALAKANSLTSVTSTSPSDLHGLEVFCN